MNPRYCCCVDVILKSQSTAFHLGRMKTSFLNDVMKPQYAPGSQGLKM